MADNETPLPPEPPNEIPVPLKPSKPWAVDDKPVPVPVFKMGPKPSRFDVLRLFISLVKQLKQTGKIEGGVVEMTPSWKTGTFWSSLLISLVTLAIGAGYLPKDFPTNTVAQLVSGVAGIAGAVAVAWKYLHIRNDQVTTTIATQAQIKVATIQAKGSAPCDTTAAK